MFNCRQVSPLPGRLHPSETGGQHPNPDEIRQLNGVNPFSDVNEITDMITRNVGLSLISFYRKLSATEQNQ